MERPFTKADIFNDIIKATEDLEKKEVAKVFVEFATNFSLVFLKLLWPFNNYEAIVRRILITSFLRIVNYMY